MVKVQNLVSTRTRMTDLHFMLISKKHFCIPTTQKALSNRRLVSLAWGVNCVKFNVHNISNMSIAVSGSNVPSCTHNLPLFMHNLSYTSMKSFMHAQLAIIICTAKIWFA